MAKRILFIFLGFVVLASLAYYGLNRWKDAREKINLWDLVPENAALVVETNNHTQLLEHLNQTELWESFRVLPAVQRFQENISWLDSLSPGNQRLARFLDKKNILTSVHVVARTDMEMVYYIPVASVGEHRFLRTLTENVARSTIFKEESRDYQGYLLTDITNTQLNTSFTYFSYHNNIILSASPVLIEEIVRRINRGVKTSVAADFRNTNYLTQPDIYANVFINYRELPDVLGLFVREDIMPQVRFLSSFCRNGMLELKLERNKIFLNGFSNPEDLQGSLHNKMNPVAARPFQVKEYLPNRTALMFHFGINQLAKLQDDSQDKIKTEAAYAATVDSLSKNFRQELALVYLESYNINTSPEKIVFARMGNQEHMRSLLAQLSRQVSEVQKEKEFSEQYGNSTISLLDVPELPAQLFGQLFTGFEQSYVVQVGDYLLFSSEIATLRSLLDDIANDHVWGRSVQQKAFLEETLQDGNFSLFLNTVNAWYVLSRYMQEENREDLLQHSSLIKRFNQVSLQFSKVENQYYTSFLFRRQERAAVAGEAGFEEELSLPFNSRIVSMPFPVNNAVDRSREVVVQDSANVLHNITAAGTRGWADTLSGAVRGTIKQIEVGPDKKLRYVFATSNRIHAINNQGQELENFPFNLTDTLRVQRVSVFDYEKDGNYRFLADDNLGNLYMYDFRGNAMPGWQPRRLDYRLAAEPQHIRVGGLDVILVLLENGYVYALNKEGETYPGFPFSLRVPLNSGAIAKAGADLRRTEITTVTRYGEVVVFNLQGTVLRREQLLRPSKRAVFELVPDNSNRSFIIVRQDLGKVAVFNQDLEEIFEKNYVTSAPKIVQYFHFGGDKRVYAITETGPQKTYLYDARAALIGGRSLESNQPVNIFFNEAANNYTLYKVYRRELKRLSFRLPN
ncbi:PQQ-like beta-propeller repeat protein [Pontibacter sp. SGAir0037]|uniref:PQQ-like beta-propeller repeat protein n=1 Tax=Pontibacter sp. SGAir0037 TaxID=2571030 RepID=UPI0010CD24A5|nr:PQQ-like beta-propeller repeat protein [Pontibacter sp. SGAir0037]QCR23328.1 hypothetical protein C1N53_13925 [Pontibacter sp. SGAir0037]